MKTKSFAKLALGAIVALSVTDSFSQTTTHSKIRVGKNTSAVYTGYFYENPGENSTIVLDGANSTNPNLFFMENGSGRANIRVFESHGGYGQLQFFAGGSGITGQPLAMELYNGKVGIGTLPQYKLHIKEQPGDFRSTNMMLDAASGLNPNMFFGYKGNAIGNIRMVNGSNRMDFQTASTDGGSMKTVLSLTKDGKAFIGVESHDLNKVYFNYTLAVNGVIGSKGVRVENGSWADYVFKEDYKLMPIEEVEEFISSNGHLPDVPSEKEVLKNGTDVAKMDEILLRKIEELTLYIIEQQKQINSLKGSN